MSCKLFVANIGWRTTDDSYNKLFASYEGVTDTMIMRDRVTNKSRGFGFITCESNELANTIMAEEIKLDGRVLEFKPAVSKEDMQQGTFGQAPATKKLYVAGISYSSTEDAVRDYFSQFGELESAELIKNRTTQASRGFAFVTFVDAKSVQDCLSASLELDGRRLDVKLAVPKGQVQPSYGPQRGRYGRYAPQMGMQQGPGNRQPPRKSKKIFIAGLPPDAEAEDLDAHFRQFGTITETVVKKDSDGVSRGFGFVFFAEESSAQKAVATTNHPIKGKNVDIKIAIPKYQMQAKSSAPYVQQQQPPYGGMDSSYSYSSGYNQPGPYNPRSNPYAAPNAAPNTSYAAPSSSMNAYGNQSNMGYASSGYRQDYTNNNLQPSYSGNQGNYAGQAYAPYSNAYPQQGAAPYSQQPVYGYSETADNNPYSTHNPRARDDKSSRAFHPYR